MNFKISEIVDICDGELFCGKADLNIDNFSIDTRTITKNSNILRQIRSDRSFGYWFQWM